MHGHIQMTPEAKLAALAALKSPLITPLFDFPTHIPYASCSSSAGQPLLLIFVNKSLLINAGRCKTPSSLAPLRKELTVSDDMFYSTLILVFAALAIVRAFDINAKDNVVL